MPILKVYSEIDADLYIDFQKVCSIGSCQMIPITLDDGQYFVRLNTKNPLLYKEGIISLTGPQVFLAKKEDFLSKLTETQLSGLQFIKVREGKRVYIKELISGIPFSAAYESIGEFNEGICPVLANGKVGFIDRTCKEVIPCIYEDYDTINNGIICIKQYDKWGAINLNKEIIIPIIYDKCSECEDGFWSINKDGEWDYDMYGQKRFSGGRWGICDRNGKEIIPCKFSEIHSNGDGIFLCKGSLDSNGSDALFDSKGSELIPKNIISTIYPFKNTNYLFQIRQNGKWGVVRSNGEFIAQCIYENIDEFYEGICPVKLGGKWYFIDTRGHYVDQRGYDSIQRDNTTGIYIVKYSNYFGILNTHGKLVVNCIYESIRVEKGFFIIKQSGKEGVHYSDNKLLISAEFNRISIHSCGYCTYFVGMKNSKEYLYKIDGTIAFSNGYDSIKEIGYDYIIVKNNDYYGIISTCGIEIAPIIYTEIRHIVGIGFAVKLNGNWGILSSGGKTKIPCNYYYIGPENNGLCPVNTGGESYKLEYDPMTGSKYGCLYWGGITNGKWGYINADKEIFPCIYDKCSDFEYNLAVVVIGDKMGVINTTGNIVVPIKYSYCKVLSPTLILIANDAELRLANSEFDDIYSEDPKAKGIYGLKMTMITYSEERLSFIFKGGKYGLYCLGEEIVKPAYDIIKPNKELSLFIVKKGNKYGVIDKSGTLLVDCITDSISFFN